MLAWRCGMATRLSLSLDASTLVFETCESFVLCGGCSFAAVIKQLAAWASQRLLHGLQPHYPTQR